MTFRIGTAYDGLSTCDVTDQGEITALWAVSYPGDISELPWWVCPTKIVEYVIGWLW